MSEMFQRVGDSHILTVPDWYDPTELVTRFAATGIPMTEETIRLVKLVSNGKKSVEDIFPTPSFELVSGMQIRVRALNLVAHATMTIDRPNKGATGASGCSSRWCQEC